MKLKKISPKPYQGIIIFVLSISVLLLTASFQINYGMYGLAITEFSLLALGLLIALIYKDNLKDIFPFAIPKIGQILGVFLLWIGVFLVNILVSLLIQYFFPTYAEVSSYLGDFFSSINITLALIIGALLPAICEEIVHRGVILHTFKNIENKWIKIIIMGIIFGAFHLDPYRFLPTAILGIMLTYIMVTSKNIILPMFLHLINNMTSISLSFISSSNISSSSTTSSSDVLLSIGSIVIVCSLVPLLFYFGVKLLKGKNTTQKKVFKKRYLILIIISIIAIGSSIIAYSMSLSVFSISEKFNATQEDSDVSYTFTVKDSREYQLYIYMENEIGVSEVTIIDENNIEKYSFSAGSITLSDRINLEMGEYHIIITPHIKDDPAIFEMLGFEYTDELKEQLKLTNAEDATSLIDLKIVIK